MVSITVGDEWNSNRVAGQIGRFASRKSQMIISHRYKYVFVEVPRTGSTAISTELQKHYGGESILKKHSYYSTFLESATDIEKQYRVISGIRNPLDDAVSVYRKFSTKDRDYYAGSNRNLVKYDRINANSLTFSEYLVKFYRLPYDHWTSTYHSKFDVVIRFENLQEGFSQAVEMIGARQVRPLPKINTTDRKDNFVDYYSKEDISRAIRIFGPYMATWGYDFPEEWGAQQIPASSWLVYNSLRGVRRYYWNHIRQGSGVGGRAFQRVFLK